MKIKNIKYCNNINIPESLIENKNEVAKETKSIDIKEISSLIWILRKILILKYVAKIQTKRNGISVVLKKPWPIKYG